MVARDDYYREGGEAPGRFFGEGAEWLGIADREIGHKDRYLQDLFLGVHPLTKETLRHVSLKERTYIVNGETRIHSPVIGYDFTFSAPKSVSVLWSQADLETRRMIEECHRGAVTLAIAHLEGKGVTTRTGHGGAVVEEVKPIFAAFTHTTSRATDPQLHDHVVLINTGIRENGKGGAIDGKPLFAEPYTLGAIYRNELRRLLTEELNLPTHDRRIRNGMSFEVMGVPQALVEELSKQSRAIDRAIALETSRLARSLTGKEEKAVKYAIRPLKEIPDKNALFAEWRETGKRYGFSPETVLGKPRHEREDTLRRDVDDLTRSVSKTLYHKSYSTDPKTDRPRIGLTLTDVEKAVVYHCKGRFSAAEARVFTRSYAALYLRKTTLHDGNHVYTLRKEAFQEVQEKPFYLRVRYAISRTSRNVRKWAYEAKATIREERYRSLRIRAMFLYYTGRMKHSTYKRITADLSSASKGRIQWAYATHAITKKQRDYFLKVKEKNPIQQKEETRKETISDEKRRERDAIRYQYSREVNEAYDRPKEPPRTPPEEKPRPTHHRH